MDLQTAKLAERFKEQSFKLLAGADMFTVIYKSGVRKFRLRYMVNPLHDFEWVAISLVCEAVTFAVLYGIMGWALDAVLLSLCVMFFCTAIWRWTMYFVIRRKVRRAVENSPRRQFFFPTFDQSRRIKSVSRWLIPIAATTLDDGRTAVIVTARTLKFPLCAVDEKSAT